MGQRGLFQWIEQPALADAAAFVAQRKDGDRAFCLLVKGQCFVIYYSHGFCGTHQKAVGMPFGQIQQNLYISDGMVQTGAADPPMPGV